MRNALALALLAIAAPLAAQTDTVVAGVVADSSIAAPVVVWNRVDASGDSVTATLAGWTVSGELQHRIAPRQRVVTAIAVTPLHAHSSNRVYLAGARRRDLEFDDAAIEASFGVIDTLTERWTADLRAVALYENVSGPQADYWSSPYAGVRARATWQHITADDPLLMTFEGSEVRGGVEVFGGKHVWSRASLDHRASRRFGRLHLGESATLFTGRSLNSVNAFLAGASWPLPDLRPFYGYRYAELRLDRGAGVNADAQLALTESLSLAAHESVMRSRGTTERGTAVDFTTSWRGIGIRAGVGRSRYDKTIVYGSILAAAFRR